MFPNNGSKDATSQPSFPEQDLVLLRIINCDTCMRSTYTKLLNSHHRNCPGLTILHSIIPGTTSSERNRFLTEVIGTDISQDTLHPVAEYLCCGRCKKFFSRYVIAAHIFFCRCQQAENIPFLASNRSADSIPLSDNEISSALHPYHILAQYAPSILNKFTSLFI